MQERILIALAPMRPVKRTALKRAIWLDTAHEEWEQGDLADVAAGVVPRSLMDPDDTHLNAAGLTIAANLANDRFVALGV